MPKRLSGFAERIERRSLERRGAQPEALLGSLLGGRAGAS
jgi:hypothetical protein